MAILRLQQKKESSAPRQRQPQHIFRQHHRLDFYRLEERELNPALVEEQVMAGTIRRTMIPYGAAEQTGGRIFYTGVIRDG
jgi:hypothetical protein